MMDDLWWRDADAEYIRRRSERYPGATNIQPDWTLQTAADPRAIVRDPDPKSRIGAIRIIGYSPARALSSPSSPPAVPTLVSRPGRAAERICMTTKDRRSHE